MLGAVDLERLAISGSVLAVGVLILFPWRAESTGFAAALPSFAHRLHPATDVSRLARIQVGL